MFFLFALAVAPVAFLLIFIYRRDVIAKEPKSRLALAFFGGILSSIIAFLVERLILSPGLSMLGLPGNLLPSAAFALFGAAIPEELLKLLFLWLFIWRSKYFDEYFDGIVYAVFVSMGFACVENIWYVFQLGTLNAFLRAFTAVPAHFLFAVIMGYYFSLAKFEPMSRKKHLFKGIGGAILGHAIYDFIIFYSTATIATAAVFASSKGLIVILGIVFVIGFLVFTIKLWIHGLKRIEEHRQKDMMTIALSCLPQQPADENLDAARNDNDQMQGQVNDIYRDNEI